MPTTQSIGAQTPKQPVQPGQTGQLPGAIPGQAPAQIPTPQLDAQKPTAEATAERRKTFLVKILDNLLTIHHIGDNYLGIPIDKDAIDAIKELRNQIDPTTPFNATGLPAQVASVSIHQQPNQPTTQPEPYKQYPNQFGVNEFGVQVGTQGTQFGVPGSQQSQVQPANFLDSFNSTQKGYQGNQVKTKPGIQPANQTGSTIHT